MTQVRRPTIAFLLTDREADTVEWAFKVVLEALQSGRPMQLDPALAMTLLPRLKALHLLLADSVQLANLTEPAPARGPQRDAAATFLVQLLASAGPLKWRTIADFGRAAGHTEATLRRSRDTVLRRQSRGRNTLWRLI